MICIVCYGVSDLDPSLLRLSRESGLPIAAPTYDYMRKLEDDAARMGIKIPMPELVLIPGYSSRYVPTVLVPESHLYTLAVLSRHGAVFVSIDAPHFGVYAAPKRLRDLLRWLWRRRGDRRG